MLKAYFSSPCDEQQGPSIKAEWFQVTNNTLRIAPDGDEIASLDSDGEWIMNDGSAWTDIVIE